MALGRVAQLGHVFRRYVFKHRRRLLENWIMTPPVVFLFLSMMWGIDKAFERVGFRFPSNVTGMLLVFGLLLLLQRVLPQKTMTKILMAFQPGVCFLLKWMAVFFSPALVVILNGRFIGFVEAIKVAVIFLIGMLVFIPFNAHLAGAVRRAKLRLFPGAAGDAADSRLPTSTTAGQEVPLGAPGTPIAPAPDEDSNTVDPLLARPLPTPVNPSSFDDYDSEGDEEAGHVASAYSAGAVEPAFDGEHPITDVPYAVELDIAAPNAPGTDISSRRRSVFSVVAQPAAPGAAAKQPSSRPLFLHVGAWTILLTIGLVAFFASGKAVTTILLGAANVLSYFAGMALPDRAKLLLHPLLTCTLLMWLVLYLVSLSLGISFFSTFPLYLNDFRFSRLFSATPEQMRWPGAGDVMLSVLDAAVVALGFKLFEHRAVLLRYPVELGATLGISSLVSMFFHAALARLFFCEPAVTLSLVPRAATTPLAMQVEYALGQHVRPDAKDDMPYISLCAALVVSSGIFGAVFGLSILRLSRADAWDPLVVGAAIGGTAHGIGTAALLVPFPTASAVSSISFVGFGTMCVAWSKIPAVGAALVAIARAGMG
ncbi:LrgB-like family-domain-containing protein [Hyaloraphidium curvatum]|nr:LrgB-like family-domain-containing protein [Hyaloraphidium curvatum]